MIFAPDLGPLIGPHADRRNYFCANGVMAGFNQGAGIGRVLAEWIIQGEPEVDISCWDVARFGKWATKTYTAETTRYFYENRSEKVFPYQEFDAGRPINKPAVYDRLKQAGAIFGSSFGQEHANWFNPETRNPGDSLTYRQPNWWQPVADEGRRVRNELGLMEFSAMAKFEVSGPGAEDWLNFVMAGRLPGLGRMSLSPMLSPKGRLIGDFSIARVQQQVFMVLGADYMQLAFMRNFNYHLPKPGVTVRNISADLGGLHLCGPNAQSLMCRLADREMDSVGFPFMNAGKFTVGGIDNVLVFRVSFTGETGYEMYVPMDRQLALFDILRKEGSNLGLGLVGTRCLMHTRLEKGFPAWGLELTSDYTAVEADMARFIDLEKVDFVGRQAVLDYAPPREKYATFTVDAGNDAIWGDEAIFLDGEPAGYVTSGGYGPVTEQHIALGYVQADRFEPQGRYSVEVLGKLRPAELQLKPLYDPAGTRMRA
jgi:dimethylglycine dehydrogenase